MRTTTLALALLSLLALTLAACDGTHADHCSAAEQARCEGSKISYCDGHHFGAAQSCPDDQECVTSNEGEGSCLPTSTRTNAEQDGMDRGAEGMEMEMNNMDMGDDMSGF